MAQAAYPLWCELEQQSGQEILRRVGGIDFGPKDSEAMQQILEHSTSLAGVEVLTSVEITARFPALSLPDDAVGVFQRDGAVIQARAALLAMRDLARKHGAVLAEEQRVCRISTDDKETGTVLRCVHTDSGHVYRTRKLVLTPGNRLVKAGRKPPLLRAVYGLRECACASVHAVWPPVASGLKSQRPNLLLSIATDFAST